MTKGDRESCVHDVVALDEIELYGEVLSAVAASDRPLTRDELDAILLNRSTEGNDRLTSGV